MLLSFIGFTIVSNQEKYSFKLSNNLSYFEIHPDFFLERSISLVNIVKSNAVDKQYIEELSCIIAEESWEAKIDMVKIAAIIWKETRWLEQPVSDSGKFIPSPSNDFGPMQINQIHIDKYGPGFMYDLRENIKVGIDILKQSNEIFGVYHGSGIHGEYHVSTQSKYYYYLNKEKK